MEGEREEGRKELSSWFGFPPPRNCKDDLRGRRTNVCGRTVLYVHCVPFHSPSALPFPCSSQDASDHGPFLPFTPVVHAREGLYVIEGSPETLQVVPPRGEGACFSTKKGMGMVKYGCASGETNGPQMEEHARYRAPSEIMKE